MRSRFSAPEVVTLVLLVYGAWLLLSGVYTPFLLAIGLVSTAFAVFVAMRKQLVDNEGVPLANLSSRVWSYLPWLCLEILKCNLAVTRIILHRKMPINPTTTRFRALPRTELGRFILANSMGLTPGALTTNITGSEFEVHCLTPEFGAELDTNEMNRRVAALEKGAVDS